MGPRFPSLCGLRRFVSLPDRREGCEGAPSIPPSSRLPFTHLCVFGLGLDTQHVIEVFFHGHPGCPIVACGVKRTHQLCETSPCPGWSIPPSTKLGSRTPSNPGLHRWTRSLAMGCLSLSKEGVPPRPHPTQFEGRPIPSPQSDPPSHGFKRNRRTDRRSTFPTEEILPPNPRSNEQRPRGERIHERCKCPRGPAKPRNVRHDTQRTCMRGPHGVRPPPCFHEPFRTKGTEGNAYEKVRLSTRPHSGGPPTHDPMRGSPFRIRSVPIAAPCGAKRWASFEVERTVPLVDFRSLGAGSHGLTGPMSAWMAMPFVRGCCLRLRACFVFWSYRAAGRSLSEGIGSQSCEEGECRDA